LLVARSVPETGFFQLCRANGRRGRARLQRLRDGLRRSGGIAIDSAVTYSRKQLKLKIKIGEAGGCLDERLMLCIERMSIRGGLLRRLQSETIQRSDGRPRLAPRGILK
jgi:hypothetical protein